MGHVPANMYAWAIRKDRHGEPMTAMQQEVVPTAQDRRRRVPGHGDGRWRQLQRRLGRPGHPALAASTCTSSPTTSPARMLPGIVWAVGSKVKRWKVGDEVVIHCNQDDGDDEECNGGDPMNSPSQRIWGYETPDGSLRPVLPGAVAPADAAAEAPDLGGGRLLHAGAGHRLPDAVRPSSRTRSSPATTCWSGAVRADWARWRSS